MRDTRQTITFEEATAETSEEPTEEVRAWQARKIAAGIKAADEGRFVSRETVRSFFQKYIPNG